MKDGYDLWKFFTQSIEDSVGRHGAASHLFSEEASELAVRHSEQWLRCDSFERGLNRLSDAVCGFERKLIQIGKYFVEVALSVGGEKETAQRAIR
jgi:hypothetical protein